MNWEKLLRSRPPSTGWVFDQLEAVVVHRSTTEAHCACEALPSNVFEVGAVGLQNVDAAALTPVLARLKGAAEGARTAAVIVPSNWLRSFLIDIDRAPRKEHELRDVVRWRLKKLLRVPASELRLSVNRLPELDGVRRLMVMVGLERAVDAIETAFRSVGIEVGLLSTSLFAVVSRKAGAQRPTLVIQHEQALLSLLLVVNSVPRYLRSKPLPSNRDNTAAVLREIELNVAYVRDSLGVSGEIEVRFISQNAELTSAARQQLSAFEGLVPAPEIPMLPAGPTTVVQRLGAARLAPAMAVVTGEVR
jgi:Tfp pilus assembly PilM family ATPase